LSDQAEEAVRGTSNPALSDLCEVELFSALARKVRLNEIEPEDAARVRAIFLEHLERGFFDRLSLGRRHYRLARDWLARPPVPLRSLDALHLAAAALAERVVVTADRGQSRAAEALGVSVWRLEEAESSWVSEP
jgi:predicted nucleic acid-binding protein